MTITGKELSERDFTVFVFVENGDDSFDEGVLVEFGDVEDFLGVEVAAVVLIDLFKPGVEFLDFFLGELAWKFCVTH